MSCGRCTASFGFFKKELGCNNCGFSFCSKCLCYKAVVPRLGGQKQAVCPGCYQLLTGETTPDVKKVIEAKSQAEKERVPTGQLGVIPQDPNHTLAASAGYTVVEPAGYTPGDLPPPSMRAAAARAKGAPGGPESIPPPGGVRIGNPQKVSAEDKELYERLQRLKQARQAQVQAKAIPQSEIEERLAKLRGCDPEIIRHPGDLIQPAPDRRTQAEKSRDLLDQMKDEVQLDEGVDGQAAETSGDTLDVSASTSDALTSQEPSQDTKDIEKLLNDARLESEKDANLAMEGLAKDKELMDQLNKIKDQARADTAMNDNIQNELGRPWNGPEDPSDEKELEDEAESEEDSEANRLAEQIIKEAELEDRLPPPGQQEAEENNPVKPPPRSKGNNPKSTKKKPPVTSAQGSSAAAEVEDEELPWCCICAADAVLRCSGCDGDLYCRRCYREGHDPEELKQHKWTAYKKPKKHTAV